MGKLCTKEAQSDERILVPQENEVSIPKYQISPIFVM